MSYCTVNFIRKISGLTTSDISDPDLRDIRDDVATPELNSDINKSVTKEEIDDELSDEKDNSLNGNNKTFYLKHLHDNHNWLGDRNDDGSIDNNDVFGFYLDSDDNRQDISVTVKDAEIGKLEITDTSNNALTSNDDLFVSYEVAPLDPTGPHQLIKVACAQLSAAYAFTNIEASNLEEFDVGNISVKQQSNGFADMFDQYLKTKQKIESRDVYGFGDNKETIRSENAFSNVVIERERG